VALTARAQQSAMPVVGFLSSFSSNERNTAAFNQGLKELGFVDGQNVVIDHRYTEGHYDQLPGLAADLVRRRRSP
jgi:putative tryptophan/tyrosine transport system substrate-binding protein